MSVSRSSPQSSRFKRRFVVDVGRTHGRTHHILNGRTHHITDAFCGETLEDVVEDVHPSHAEWWKTQIYDLNKRKFLF